MSRAVPPPPGPEPGAPGEDDLGRLIRESLRRDVESTPVDAARLVRGARAGAVRIRQRRRTAVGSLVVLVLAVPAAVLGVRTLHSNEAVTEASSASRSDAASDGRAVAAPAAAGGSEAAVGGGVSPAAAGAKAGEAGGPSAAAGAVSTGPPDLPSVSPVATAPTTAGAPAAPSPRSVPGTPSPKVSASASPGESLPSVSRTAALPLTVPPQGLLIAADLPSVALTRTSDTGASRAVPATAAADVCGRPPTGLPAAAAAARAVAYERRIGPSAGWWLLGSTVRVYPGAGSAAYLRAISGLPCAAAGPAGVGDGAVVTRGLLDGQGRTHWYGVVRVGRAISEVRLVVPRGGGAGAADLERLLRVAAARLTSSGLG